VGKVAALLTACKSSYKWNFSNPKKETEFGDPQDFGTFSDL
jgi:hypothetical protein